MRGILFPESVDHTFEKRGDWKTRQSVGAGVVSRLTGRVALLVQDLTHTLAIRCVKDMGER